MLASKRASSSTSGIAAAVKHEVLAQKGAQACPRRPVAAVIVEKMLQPRRRQAARGVDAARPDQDQAVDPLRRVERHPQRAGAAERIAERVGLGHAKRVEQTEHRAGEIAERILAVDALGRAPVTGHVGYDHVESVRPAHRRLRSKFGDSAAPGPPPCSISTAAPAPNSLRWICRVADLHGANGRLWFRCIHGSMSPCWEAGQCAQGIGVMTVWCYLNTIVQYRELHCASSTLP